MKRILIFTCVIAILIYKDFIFKKIKALTLQKKKPVYTERENELIKELKRYKANTILESWAIVNPIKHKDPLLMKHSHDLSIVEKYKNGETRVLAICYGTEQEMNDVKKCLNVYFHLKGYLSDAKEKE